MTLFILNLPLCSNNIRNLPNEIATTSDLQPFLLILIQQVLFPCIILHKSDRKRSWVGGLYVCNLHI